MSCSFSKLVNYGEQWGNGFGIVTIWEISPWFCLLPAHRKLLFSVRGNAHRSSGPVSTLPHTSTDNAPLPVSHAHSPLCRRALMYLWGEEQWFVPLSLLKSLEKWNRRINTTTRIWNDTIPTSNRAAKRKKERKKEKGTASSSRDGCLCAADTGPDTVSDSNSASPQPTNKKNRKTCMWHFFSPPT